MKGVFAIGMLVGLSFFILYGCKKSSDNTLSTAATDMGLQFEQKYIVSLDSATPPYVLPHADTIVFHANSTITESSGSQSVTYAVAYVAQLNELATVYLNGAALVVALKSQSIYSNNFPVFNGALGTDTAVVATYETGTIAAGGTPALGCKIFTGTTGSFANYEYLWFIKE